MSKQERKGLCRLIDCRKLTQEASLHAAQNERFPVRAVIQVLLSEQTKLNRHTEWSGSIMSGGPSPNGGGWFDTARCLSKREINAQHVEIRKLKEDVQRLQGQCSAMQVQMEKMVEKKKGFFKWKKFPFSKGESAVLEKTEQDGVEFERQTPGAATNVDMKTRLVTVKGKTPQKWRKSMS